MRGPKAVPIELTPDERDFLERVSRKQTLSHREVTRAKIVLKAADGLSNAEIARHLEVRENSVRDWRKRFATERLAGLNDLPRSGAPSSFSPSGET